MERPREGTSRFSVKLGLEMRGPILYVFKMEETQTCLHVNGKESIESKRDGRVAGGSRGWVE